VVVRAGSGRSTFCARGAGASAESFRGDQAVVAQPRRHPPDQGGEDGPVGPVQAWSIPGGADTGLTAVAAARAGRQLTTSR
jgi:hypothetical protein